MKILKVSDRGQLTIPYTVRSRTGIKKGQKVLITSKDDQVIIKPLPDDDVMSLYGAVDPKDRSADPAKAISETRKIRSRKILSDNDA